MTVPATKTVWCRYHNGYVTQEDTTLIVTGSGTKRQRVRICLKCKTLRDLPRAEQKEVTSGLVKNQKADRRAMAKYISNYNKKMKESLQ